MVPPKTERGSSTLDLSHLHAEGRPMRQALSGQTGETVEPYPSDQTIFLCSQPFTGLDGVGGGFWYSPHERQSLKACSSCHATSQSCGRSLDQDLHPPVQDPHEPQHWRIQQFPQREKHQHQYIID